MGSSQGCPRRNTVTTREPLEEPEPSQGEQSPDSYSDCSSRHSSAEVVATDLVPQVESETVALPVRTFVFDRWVCRHSCPLVENWNDNIHRIYVVFVVPRHPEPHFWCGIHWSEGLSAYSAVISLNQGVFSGIRWQRVASLDAAHQLWVREADQHEVGNHVLWYYQWQLR